MANKNILKLEVNNQTKHLEKYLKPQWTWRTYFLIFSLIITLIFIVIDLEINFIALFSDSSKYFGDILDFLEFYFDFLLTLFFPTTQRGGSP